MPGRLESLRPVEERDVLRVVEAAARIGISTWSYYEAARRGEVPILKVGNRLVVPKVQLDAFLAGTWVKPA